MKLVELLARELDVWPEQAECATQEGGGCAYFWKSDRLSYVRGDWVHGSGYGLIDADWSHSLSELATDHATAIITRADWEAERARIAGGWIAWGGGECPVPEGTLIDIKCRDGQRRDYVECGTYGTRTNQMFWDHCYDGAEVIAYRLHKPEHASIEAINAGIAAADAGQVKPIEEVKAMYEYNPIHTRDRINTIDFDIHSLTTERAQLVQRLADEGFALIQVVAQVEFGDPGEWMVGDLLEITGEEEGHEFEIGQIVTIARIDQDDECMPYYCKPSIGDGEPWFVNSNEAKFHSRPTA